MSEPKAPIDWEALHQHPQVQTLLDLAIQEDRGVGDLTTQAIFRAPQHVRAHLVARKGTVACGLPLARELLRRFDETLECVVQVAEGERVEANTVLAVIAGDVRTLLTAERPTLNFLMRLCGIAAASRAAADAVPVGCKAKIYDTRKTMPGWRLLDKAAVKTGGCENHRVGLFDAVLIKDNHLAAAGSISEAVRRARERVGKRMTVELEIDGLHQLDEALAAAPDILMLDNFTLEDMRAAVARVNGRIPLEASGGVTLASIPDIARTGVERISSGALTHSAPPADLALDFVP